MYEITINHIPGLPSTPYRYGVGAYEGTVAHATDVFGDTAINERNYEVYNWQNAYVHYFVDYQSIIEVADPNYKAWGAGSVANPRYVHIELCQVKNDGTAAAKAKFTESYYRYIWLHAKLLYARKLGVSDATLWSHYRVSYELGGTTHEDPLSYFASWSLTWQNFVNDVTYLYNGMEAEEEGYTMTAEDANKIIGLLQAVYDIVPDKELGRLADELRKASNQPTQNLKGE